MMTKEEMREAKRNLHNLIVDEILSHNGTYFEDVEMWKYVIDLAVCEIGHNYAEASDQKEVS